jgi:hypothetical protein
MLDGTAVLEAGGDGLGVPKDRIFFANASPAHHRILSPVRLPYSWYWKHVAVILKGFDCKAVTILPCHPYIIAMLG